MNGRRSTGALLAMAASCLALGCATGGELDATTFQLGGGPLPSDGWDPEAPIASGSTFTVTATAVDGEGESLTVALHSSDEAILTPTAEAPASHAWASFTAGEAGQATINLVDRQAQVWLGGLDLEVGEPDSVDLRLAGERTAPEEFAVALGSVMAARVELSGPDGLALNHWDVATAASDDPVLEVDGGGDVLKVTPLSPGEAQVTVAAGPAGATATYRVSAVYASSIAQLQLAVHQQCGAEQATVVAEPATADGLPVLGQPVSWSLPEGTPSLADADTVRVTLADGAATIPVTASVAGLSTTIELAPADCEPVACAVAPLGRGPSPWIALPLLAAAAALARRRP